MGHATRGVSCGSGGACYGRLTSTDQDGTRRVPGFSPKRWPRERKAALVGIRDRLTLLALIAGLAIGIFAFPCAGQDASTGWSAAETVGVVPFDWGARLQSVVDGAGNRHWVGLSYNSVTVNNVTTHTYSLIHVDDAGVLNTLVESEVRWWPNTSGTVISGASIAAAPDGLILVSFLEYDASSTTTTLKTMSLIGGRWSAPKPVGVVPFDTGATLQSAVDGAGNRHWVGVSQNSVTVGNVTTYTNSLIHVDDAGVLNTLVESEVRYWPDAIGTRIIGASIAAAPDGSIVVSFPEYDASSRTTTLKAIHLFDGQGPVQAVAVGVVPFDWGARLQSAVDGAGNRHWVGVSHNSATVGNVATHTYSLIHVDDAGVLNTLVESEVRWSPDTSGTIISNASIAAAPDGSLVVSFVEEARPSETRTLKAMSLKRTLGELASEYAKSVEGAPYVLGAKGWDYKANVYVYAPFIVSSPSPYDSFVYWRYGRISRNPDRFEWGYGYGLDCSGLVLWAYNKAYAEVHNYHRAPGTGPQLPIFYVNAAGQYAHNTRALTTTETPAAGDLLFFDYLKWVPDPTPDNPKRKKRVSGTDGQMDHVVIYIGDDRVMNAGSTPQEIVNWTVSKALDDIPGYTGEFRRPTHPGVDFQARVYCPVNLIVTDPEGHTIGADSWVVTESEAYRSVEDELYYSEGDLNDDGELDDVVYSPTLKDGTYTIQVVPEPDADPARTYTLEIVAKETVVELAKDVPVGSIPSGGYSVRIENGEVVQSIRNVGDLVTLSESNKSTTLDRQTRKLTSVSTVTITNNSVSTIRAPLHLVVVANLAAGATMPEASGTTAENDYYYDLEGKLGLTALAPGQSAVVPIKFVYPSNVRIQYGLEFWGTAP